jgi:peptidyl-prolyl cis-trans isomerase D
VVSAERFPFTGTFTWEDMMGYYKAHQDAYTRPDEVRARHILIKVPPNASGELEAKIRTRVEDILAKLRHGDDFAALAKAYSEDPASAEQGGDLGFFPRGRMVPEFEATAFDLPVGQVSEPVRSQFGFHIIRVDDKTAAGVKTFEEAEAEIRAALRQEREAEATLTFVDDLMVMLEEDPTQFAHLAAQHDLKVVTTPFVAHSDRLPDFDQSAPLVQRAFALTQGAVDAIPGAEGKHYILQLVAIQPATVQPFEAVEAQVREDLKREKSRDIARQTADDWAAQVQGGAPLETLAATMEVQVENTGLFKRDDALPQFGRSPAFSRTAFDLKVNDASAVQEGGGYVVFQVTERQAATMEGFEAEKAAARERVLTQKQQRTRAAFNEFLQAQYLQLRQEGDIVVNPQYVF